MTEAAPQVHHVVEVPKGSAHFVGIYNPWSGGDGNPNFGLSVPIDLFNAEDLSGVKVSETKGMLLVTLRSKFRIEVEVAGFKEDPNKWQWLREEHNLLELRNLGRDHLLRENPLRLTFIRYQFTPMHVTGNLTCDAEGRHFGLGLKAIEVVAKEI